MAESGRASTRERLGKARWRALRLLGRVLLWLGRLATAFVLLSSLWVASYRVVDPPTTPYILWESWRLDGVDQRWRPIERISADVSRSVVAAEDSGFCAHGGVEINAILEALADWRETGTLRGGSTITQQAAKNLFLWQDRSFVRKAFEAWFSGLMELFLPKRRILELYLNVAEFGEGVFGVEAGAQRAYGVSAEVLALWRATRLAAVLPAPKLRNAAELGPDLLVRADAIADGARTLAGGGGDRCFIDD